MFSVPPGSERENTGGDGVLTAGALGDPKVPSARLTSVDKKYGREINVHVHVSMCVHVPHASACVAYMCVQVCARACMLLHVLHACTCANMCARVHACMLRHAWRVCACAGACTRVCARPQRSLIADCSITQPLLCRYPHLSRLSPQDLGILLEARRCCTNSASKRLKPAPYNRAFPQLHTPRLNLVCRLLASLPRFPVGLMEAPGGPLP